MKHSWRVVPAIGASGMRAMRLKSVSLKLKISRLVREVRGAMPKSLRSTETGYPGPQMKDFRRASQAA
jgi:hypothetical protein